MIRRQSGSGSGSRSRNFMKEFYHCAIGSSSWLRQQSEKARVSGLQTERIKGCLGGVLRTLCFSSRLYFFSERTFCDVVLCRNA